MALPAFGIPQQQTAVAVPACEVDVVLFSYSLRTSRTYSTNQDFFLENKSGLCFYVSSSAELLESREMKVE